MPDHSAEEGADQPPEPPSPGSLTAPDATLAPRLLSAPLLALVIVADFALTGGAVAVFALGWLAPVQRATGGLIDETLIANLMLFAVVVVGIVFGLGRLRPRDVGLRVAQIGPAALATILIWVWMQVAIGVWSLASGQGLAIDPAWAQFGALAVLGNALGQFFGNALYEEVVWRGMALPQFYRRCVERWPAARGLSMAALIAALVISQGLFALRHIPVRVWQGASLGDLPGAIVSVFAVGVILAALYLRTRNLLLVIGIHALYDAPTALIAHGSVAALLALGLAVLIPLLWPRALSWGRTRPHASSRLTAGPSPQ
ncbi:MAG: CPBP family intramembrane glutamic endopeptidase [Ktedonobacterales bacterium]